mgnify:CR=1 FL=1
MKKSVHRCHYLIKVLVLVFNDRRNPVGLNLLVKKNENMAKFILKIEYIENF